MAFSAARRWPLLVRRPALTCDQAEALLLRLFDTHTGPSFGVRLWDGRRVIVGSAPAVTFQFGDAETFARCIGSEDPSEFAEAYAGGRLTVDGDLEHAAGVALALRDVDPGLAGRLAFVSRLGTPTSRHTADDDERDVRAHYDLSNDFFRLFLDSRMVYSCAYFETPDQDLEQAQARKLDLICRKLGLVPGDDFLDIGSGWGGLLIWAASHYGVRAQGLTLSVNQEVDSRRRIAEANLGDRARVVREHYDALGRDMFDAIASVGMYEHVGLRRLSDYCRAAYRALRPGGLFLNHGITLPVGQRSRTGGEFIFRHIFPGAELLPLSTVQSALEETGFEVLDVQSLRPHYALTLRAWYARFQQRRAEAVRLTSERTVRMWEVYLAGCARTFELGLVAVHQILVAKPGGDRRRPPLTRAAWDANLGASVD
jgi:cyclopropane-fatty-acyl-phospholipid synthase